MTFLSSILFAVIVGTWNGEWFPSGRAEHRAEPKVEAATIAAAGKMLRGGIAALDPAGTNDVILCLNEIRDREAAEALCRAIGRKGLEVAIISRYRRRDRFDQQQEAILTTLPVVKANWCTWKVYREDTAPRGYAAAEVVFPGAVTTAVYAVHLKSNYGATTPAENAQNARKRARAIDQLLEQEKPKRKKYRMPVILAGDFNADRHAARFRDETIFASLDAAGFTDAFKEVSVDDSVTHPGRGRFEGDTFDYIFHRGFRGAPKATVIPAYRLSDHHAVFLDLR